MARLGLWEAVAIGVGGMIGGGIFAVLGLAIETSKYGAPLSFLFAGLVAALTAYSYSKLSLKYPSMGGTVEFLGMAFRHGFFVGSLNLLLLLSYIIMLSLYAYAFGSYASALLGGGEHLRHLFTSAVIIIFAALNLMGSEAVGRSEEVIVLAKVLILLVVVLAGIGFIKIYPISSPPLNIISGGMLIFLAYEGFELIANVSPEVEKPKRNIPLAFYISVAIVTALYVLISLVVLGALPLESIIKKRDYALAATAQPLLGNLGFLLVVFAALLSTASAINATIYGSARIAYTLAMEGELPTLFKKSWSSPAEGVLFVTLMSLLISNLVSLKGISTAGSAGFLLIFAAVNAAAFLLRKQIGANGIITFTGLLLCIFSFLVLLLHQFMEEPASVVFFATLLGFSVIIEAVARLVGRKRLSLTFWRE